MDRIIKRVDFPKIMQPQALKVCAYTRVSSGKDAMLHSLSAQVSHYSEMIQSHIGWGLLRCLQRRSTDRYKERSGRLSADADGLPCRKN